MIRKSIDKIKATNTQKKDIYDRICADYEKSEGEEKKAVNKFLKYGIMAAATVLVLGAVTVVVSLIVNMQGVPVTHPESIDSTGSSVSVPENSNNSSHLHNEEASCDWYPPGYYDKYPELYIDTKPIIMTWEDIDENSEPFDIFKRIYGVPENKPSGYEDTPDENVLCYVKKVNYSDRYVDLAKMLSADDAPDIFPYEASVFPISIYKNLFQDVDDVMDFSNVCWETHNRYIDNFRWQGKTYTPILSVDATQYLWYRKSIIEEYGFDDPYTLYKQGKWDYDAFFDMTSEFSACYEDNYGIDGYPETLASFVATTGKGLFSIKNGELVDNLYDDKILNTIDAVLTKFNAENNRIRYPIESMNNWQPSYIKWVWGETLFFAGEKEIYETQWGKYKDIKEWDDDEVQFVPFPTVQGSKENYFPARINSYMLCSGSKNIQGYAAFMHSMAWAEYEKRESQSTREALKQTYGWTDELLDRIEETTGKGNTPVFDISGLNLNYNSALIYIPYVYPELIEEPFRGGVSFEEQRDKYINNVNEILDELNGKNQ